MPRRDHRVPRGKLAVLVPGLGAVATTFFAGVELLRQGRARPVGSYTQLGLVPLPGKGGPHGIKVKDLVPLARPEDLVFGAWDIVDENGAEVALRSEVLSLEHVEAVHAHLQRIRPKRGIHAPELVRRISANHVKPTKNHRESVEALRQDIRDFMRELEADRAVMIFCASTEAYRPPGPAHQSLRNLEKALDASDPAISPTLLYAYAALCEGVPFVNGTPNLAIEAPALQELARAKAVPIAGKDFKSGQTMIKTALAPALRARLLGLRGWFSTNILGNRDGEVLDDPESFRSKQVTKSGVLDTILDPEVHVDLYAEVSHKVSIHYYPPRGDQKESWDSIDLFGWLGYPMQLKVNFLCRDSILAAPLVLDLALLLDLAARSNKAGLQEWLSFYFKCPATSPGSAVVHDLFAQQALLEQGLRDLAAERALPAQSGADAV